MEKQMNVETIAVDEKTACACLFLSEDLTAIVASQAEEIEQLKSIVINQVGALLKKDSLLESKDDLIERLNIDLAAERGKLHGF